LIISLLIIYNRQADHKALDLGPPFYSWILRFDKQYCLNNSLILVYRDTGVEA